MRNTYKLPMLLLAALLLGLFLTGCNQGGQSGAEDAAPAIGVVDAKKVMEDSAVAKEGMAGLQEMSENLSGELQSMQADMGDNATQEQRKAMQQAVGQARNELSQAQQRLNQQIGQAFEKVVERIRQEKGLTAVLVKDQVMAYAPSADVTPDVIKAMDEMDVDVTLKAPEGEGQQPEPEMPGSEQ